MTTDPDDQFDLAAVIDGLTWLDTAGKLRVSEFVVGACPGVEWGGAQLATILVAGLGCSVRTLRIRSRALCWRSRRRWAGGCWRWSGDRQRCVFDEEEVLKAENLYDPAEA